MLLLALATGLIAAVIALAIALVAAGIVANLATRVPYVPAPAAAVERALDLLDVKPGQRVVDLGCGDGRFVFAAAARGAQAEGYELAIWPLIRAHVRRLITRSPARLHWSNYLRTPLHDVDAAYAYLVTPVMAPLAAKLATELRDGARVVCYGPSLPGWTPTQVHEPVAGAKNRFHLYVK